MIPISLAADNPTRRCIRYSKELYSYFIQKTISDAQLNRSFSIIQKMENKCWDYGMVVESGEQVKYISDIPAVFAEICGKAISTEGVARFFEFRMAHWDSADEDLSLALEKLFVKKPAEVLKKIREQKANIRTGLLNDIAWGFINNRLYGVENPFEYRGLKKSQTLTQFTDHEKYVEKLNINTYRTIFFNLNEDLHQLSSQYPGEIHFILRKTREYFEMWGD